MLLYDGKTYSHSLSFHYSWGACVITIGHNGPRFIVPGCVGKAVEHGELSLLADNCRKI